MVVHGRAAAPTPDAHARAEPDSGRDPSAERHADRDARADAAPTPSASAAPTDPAGAAGTDVILPIVAALAIVLIAAGFLLSRRGRPSDGA